MCGWPLRSEALPHAPQCSRDCAGRARRPLRQHPQQPPERLRVARLRMPARLQNEECPERAEHHALLTLPDRLEASAQHVSARVIEQQQVLPLAVMRSADQRQLALAFDAGVCQRQPSGIGADPLPRLHLALIAPFRDLLVEVERSERMDEIWREAFGVDLDSSFRQALPMRLRPFAEARHDANAGDPNLAWHLSHERGPRWGTRGSRPSSPCWLGTRGWEIQPAGT